MTWCTDGYIKPVFVETEQACRGAADFGHSDAVSPRRRGGTHDVARRFPDNFVDFDDATARWARCSCLDCIRHAMFEMVMARVSDRLRP